MTDDGDSTTGGTGSGRADRPRWLTALAVAAALTLVVGLVVLAMGFRHSHQLKETAQQRDAAVTAAAQILVGAYSFDYRDVDSAVEALRSASTGEFLNQQQQWSEEVKDRVIEQQAVTAATISNSAIQRFDKEAGIAEVLFVFTARSERANLPTVTGRQAAVVHVTREDDTWKVSQIIPVGVVVPVGESSESVQELQDDPGLGTSGDTTTTTDTTTSTGSAERPATSGTSTAPRAATTSSSTPRSSTAASSSTRPTR